MLQYLRKNNLLLPLLVCAFLISSTLLAQDANKTIPLPILLKQVEKQFDVKFSYTLTAVENLSVSQVPPNASLQQTLDHIFSETGLQMRMIGNRYIALYSDSTTGDQSVCGTLIDTQTGTPIAGATIIGTAIAVSTDEAGFFQVDGISKDEKLTISYLGFEIKEIYSEELQNELGCPLVFANTSVNFLETVVLENYIAKGISKNADGSVSISQQNFEILPSLIEPDVLQIVQILPGVESTDETTENINIRGGKNDEVLLLWNGIRMYQSSHFFGLISALNPNLTDDVTIYKNGTHPRFGESTSGVISITSNNEIPEQVTGGGGINLISANLYAKIPASETFALNLSGRTSINSGIGNPVYNQFYNRVFQNTVVTNLETDTEQGLRSSNEDFNFYDLSIKAIWDVTKKDKFTFSFLAINNKLDFTELFIADTNSSSNQSVLKQSSTVNGAQWVRSWNPKLSTKLHWHGSSYTLDESTREVNTERTNAQENKVDETEFDLETTYRFSKNFVSTAGFSYTDTAVNNRVDSITTTSQSLIRNSLFVNNRWKLNRNRTILSAGVRFTSYPTLNDQFLEPRFAVYQKINPHFSVTLTGEQKNQGVLQFTNVENPFLGVENKRWILADGNELPLLESEQLALGATFKKDNWGVSGTVYFKKVEGVSSTTQGFRNQFIDVATLGSYDAKGFELSIHKKSKSVNAWLSYSFANSDYTFPELSPSIFRNNFAIEHSVNLAVTYAYKSFLFSLGSNYKTGNPYTSVVDGNEATLVDNTPTINYNSPNGETLDSYFRTDFSTAYSFKLDETFRGKINLALINLFDKKNALETYYKLRTDAVGETTVNKIEQFSLGFTPNISFQLIF